MKNKIISCFGQANCGKDTTCDYLFELFKERMPNLIWNKSKFAYNVKKIFMDYFNVDEDFIEKWKRIKEIPDGFLKTVRESLQCIGDGFRSIKENVWIESCLSKDGNKLISDGRYFNEAFSTKSYDSFNILIWRPGSENNDTNLSESQIGKLVLWCSSNLNNGMINYQDYMPSELKFFDYFLINKKDLNYLYSIIKEDLFIEILKYV